MSKHYLIQKVTTIALVVAMFVCGGVTASATSEKVQELAGLNDTIAVMQTLDVYDTQRVERELENMMISSYAPSSISNFTKCKVYLTNTFSDVKEDRWSFDYIKSAFEFGIIDGVGNNLFNPHGSLTGAEAIKIGAIIHSIYKNGDDYEINHFAKDNQAWYEKYVLYAKAEKLVGNEFDNLLKKPISRAQMVHCWSKLLQSDDLEKRNSVAKIPDVDEKTLYYQEIIAFYESGIISGTDEQGTFKPNDNISREQCATIFMRLVKPSLRTSGKTYASEAQRIGDVEFNPKTDITYDSHGNAIISRECQNRFIESMINRSQGVVISNGKRMVNIDFDLVDLPDGYSWSISVDWGIPNKSVSGTNTDRPGVIQNGHFIRTVTADYTPTYYEVTICIVDAEGNNAGQLGLHLDLNNPDQSNVSYDSNDILSNTSSWIDGVYTIK